MRRRNKNEPVDPTVQAARITRRGTVVTALASVIVALVGGVFAAYKVGNDQGAAGVAPTTVTVVSTARGSGTAPTSAPATPVAQASEVSAQVRLDAGSGIDLDAADPRPVEASGPNGDVDVYFGNSLLSVNRSAAYYYSGTENDAKIGCPKTVAHDTPVPGGGNVVSAGSQFCVKTSKGTVGWISCNDVKYSGVAAYLVLNYQIFG